MTEGEILDLKRKMEDEIHDVLLDFVHKTGLRIKGVLIEIEPYVDDITGREQPISVRVEIVPQDRPIERTD